MIESYYSRHGAARGLGHQFSALRDQGDARSEIEGARSKQCGELTQAMSGEIVRELRSGISPVKECER